LLSFKPQERDMGIFSNIMDKIFGHKSKAAPTTSAVNPVPAPAPAPTPSAAPISPEPPRPQAVDVTAVLDELAADNPQKLDWRHSIVDLMKLVGMESSLSERKELADELGYTGDKGDSATMNIWLHKQVIKKLGENGGKAPAELMD
jgi:3-oxoacyl-ACP reductase-like protein